MSYFARISRVLRVIAFIAVLGIVRARDGFATPETWIVPSISLEGTASSARFGNALACSKANATSNYRSYVAVGAPHENSGQGKVHIFDPGDSVNPILSIPSPNISPLGFGSSVAFITDLNSDGIDDLAVGEPGTGSVYIYTSFMSGSALSYLLCTTHQLSMPYGETMLGLRGPFTPAGYNERLVVADPDSGSVYGLNLSGGCGVSPSYGSRFTASTGSGGMGTSLAELPDSALGDGDDGSDVIVGQPDYSIGAIGQVFLFDSNQTESIFSTVSDEKYGTALGGSYLSNFFAVGSPYRDSGRGGIEIYSGSGLVCNAQVPALEPSSLFGFTVAHLNLSFQTLFSGGSAATFAANRSESTTGGSVGIFALIAEGSCDTIKQVNNCVQDAAQEQGKVIVGGADCLINPAGTPKPMMIFSSPGWSSNKGRVDIVIEGNELATPSACAATPTSVATDTPAGPVATATSVATDTPAGPVETATSVATDTPAGPIETATSVATDTPAGPVATATSVATDTPAGPVETATSVATDTPAGPLASATSVATDTPAGPVATATSVATDTPADPIATATSVATDTPADPIATATPVATDTPFVAPVIPVPTPVTLKPGAQVPPPEVAVIGKEVTVDIPPSTILLTPSQSAQLIKILVSKYKQSKKKATDIVSNPANFFVTYEITISPASGAASVFTAQASFKIRASAGKKRQYKTRLNRVSVRNLPAGNYTASYSGQIALKKPKAIVVGSTKKSTPTKFKVG